MITTAKTSIVSAGVALGTLITAVVAAPFGLIISAATSVYIVANLVGRVINTEFDRGSSTELPRIMRFSPTIRVICEFCIAAGAAIGMVGGILSAWLIGWPAMILMLLGFNGFLVFSAVVENQGQILSNPVAVKRTKSVLLGLYYLTIVVLSPMGSALAVLTTVVGIARVVLVVRGIEIYLPPLPSQNRIIWDQIWATGCDIYRDLIMVWIPIGVVALLITLYLGNFIGALYSFVTVILSLLIFLAIETDDEKNSWN